MPQQTPEPAGQTLESGETVDAPISILVRSFGLTDPGRVRPSNEDHFLIAELARTLWVHQTSLPQERTHHGRHRGHLFLVADGMGGHLGGEVASALSVASIEAFVLHVLHRFSNLQASDEEGVVREFEGALRQADARILDEAFGHPELTGMGTVLTLALVTGWKLFVIHAGDSRCYLFHEGRLQQVTRDHTLAREMAEHGIIRAADVSRNQFRHVVTNALGGNRVGLDVEVHKVELQAGDVLLLCSDGLTDMVDDDRLAAVLAAESDPQVACERLVAQANNQGGRDNITVILARFDAA
jgi:protein phosphatase